MSALFDDTVFVYKLEPQMPEEEPHLVIFRDEVSEHRDGITAWAQILLHCNCGAENIFRAGTHGRYTREGAVAHYQELRKPLVHFRTLPSDN